MAYNRPEIVSKVTRLDKDFFENILDGVEERPTKAEADGTYAPASTKSTALLRPPSRATMANVKSMVGAFTPGHGWTSAGAGLASSDLNDTTDFSMGTQSVKLVSLAPTGTFAASKSGLSIDATGCDVRVFFKYTDPTALGSIKVMLGSGGTLNDRFEKIFFDLGSTATAVGYPALPGEWSVLDIPWSVLAATAGSPVRNNITNIQINIVNKNGVAATVRVGGVAFVYNDEMNRWPNGVVTLTFDDTAPGQWNIARPYLEQFGIRSTYFPIVGSLGGAFTLDNLKALRDRGNEIGAHAMTSATHAVGIVAPTQSQRRAELEALKQWQLDNGFDSKSYAYPLGAWSREAAQDISRYFDSARLAFANFPGSVQPEDPYRIRSVNGATQQASLNGFVDQAKAGKSWLNVTFHDIRDSGGTSNDVTVANFKAFIDYCLAQNVPIRTQGEVMAKAVLG